ncbi:MAG: hypothetical protein JOY51_04975, partial [Nevskia sp.]|nr:hypothetical protein [Nevskia sp.]
AEPQRLYRPYRLPDPAGQTAIVFRDAVLSDLIGFSYGPGGQREAARDFYQRLLAIHERCPALDDGQPPLVTVALDGENCWEHYRRDGQEFLQTLYTLCAYDPRLQFVTVREYLDRHPPSAALADLHSGSWIYADFSTWIGEPSKNRAWELLAAARQAFVAARAGLDEPVRRRLQQHLLLAEGSDWFWWFGEGHATAQKPTFDRIFREHMQAIYQGLGQPVPDALRKPVRPTTGTGPLPWRHLRALELAGGAGAMHDAERALARVAAGYDADDQLCLQVTFAPGAQPGPGEQLAVGLFYPGRTRHNAPLSLPPGTPRQGVLAYWFGHTIHARAEGELLQAWLEEAMPEQRWQARGQVDASVADREGREWEITVPLPRLDAQAGSIAVVPCLLDHARVRDYSAEPLYLPPLQQ